LIHPRKERLPREGKKGVPEIGGTSQLKKGGAKVYKTLDSRGKEGSLLSRLEKKKRSTNPPKNTESLSLDDPDPKKKLSSVCLLRGGGNRTSIFEMQKTGIFNWFLPFVKRGRGTISLLEIRISSQPYLLYYKEYRFHTANEVNFLGSEKKLVRASPFRNPAQKEKERRLHHKREGGWGL